MDITVLVVIAVIILAFRLTPLIAARLRHRRWRRESDQRRRRDTAVTQAQAPAYWQRFSAREQAAARGQARQHHR